MTMTSQTVPESLRTIIADLFDISPDRVSPDLTVGSIEGWDSFGHLQAILAMENEYGVQFDPSRIPELTSVALLMQELEAHGVTFRT